MSYIKNEPDIVQNLRDSFEGIEPGHHIHKAHWNTVNIQGNLPMEEIKKLIDMSYELVVKSLPKRERDEIKNKL
ncbi:MAG TPA: hypothetical protein DCO79_09925 [Spirochaeta sp.]|nr:hypothetical protein [Spirochaeta sp.]